MRFDFQQMRPVIQREFDEVMDLYPTDMEHLISQIPEGGDPYIRKEVIFRLAAEHCPVHVFPHYPFAYELDSGEVRHISYQGIGNFCRGKSGVDFSPIWEFRRKAEGCNLGNFNDYTDHIHRTLDHEKLLRVGFRGVYEECQRLNETETDAKKKRYREIVMLGCKTVEQLGLRLREKAAEMLPLAEDEDARYNLQRIVSSVNTPWEPPVTYFDVLNAILCTTLWISAIDGVEMNAFGQIDLLAEPYYTRDIAEGRITEEEAYFLMQCFLWRTDLRCHFNDERKTYDNGTSVMIGGCDTKGNTVYNPVTDMVLRAYGENTLMNPKLNARASKDSPRAYFEGLSRLMRQGNNNLVVQNDDYVIPMFLRMGLSPEDARTYVGNGCQEVICRNQIHSRAFVYINTVQILLDTMLREKETLSPDAAELYRYGAFEKDSFETLYASFLKNLRSYIRSIAEAFAPFERIHHTVCPEPMLSAFSADCVARGMDLSEGGARYNHKTMSLVGFGTLCDSLLSLKRAYENGTQAQLFHAVETDFAGNEGLQKQLWRSRDRFGHSESADEFAAKLAEDLAGVSDGIVNAHGIRWNTSLFTYYQFKRYGMRTGATPDGRKAGEALSRQMNMARLPDLTDAARSMAKLTEAAFCDVGMFDIALPFTVTDSENAGRALADYIRTCMTLKIPVLQTNVADVKTMREEREKKGTHPDLAVRVCGYSAFFGQLDAEMQDEIIARAGA